jgi:autotransporter-associated beta strand protein
MPGLQPGIYDRPVMNFDLLPTLVNAAGGDASSLDTDGADLVPYLADSVEGDPHEYLFWRRHNGRFAVRKGDWKLTRAPDFTYARLYNIAEDPGERTPLNTQHPELVAELHRELTNWEVGLTKPKWGAFGAPKNRFDHFVHRNDLGASSGWNAADGWKQAGTDHNATFNPDDAYANAILEFQVRNDSDYTSTNNMVRMSSQTFMLNQMRFTGEFAGAENRTGTINGNSLLFVNNLNGDRPQLRIDAASSGGQNQFAFRLDNELQLYHDLEITGDGTQPLIINGNVRNYYESRGIIKTGSSHVTLAGNNTFTGPLVINGGHVTATSLAGGMSNHGGVFSPGTGTSLTSIAGNFEQSSGVLDLELAGSSRGSHYDTLSIAGDVALGGSLRISFTKDFDPTSNHSFDILDWTGSLTGRFEQIELPALGDGLSWNTADLYETGKLRITGRPVPGDFNGDDDVDAADYVTWRKRNPLDFDEHHNDWNSSFGKRASFELLEGDFNADGTVDAADFVVVRKQLGQGGAQANLEAWNRAFAQSGDVVFPAADFNKDRVVDTADYVAWRKYWSTSSGQIEYHTWLNYFGYEPSASAQSGAVPEPTTLSAFIALICALHALRRRS